MSTLIELKCPMCGKSVKVPKGSRAWCSNHGITGRTAEMVEVEK